MAKVCPNSVHVLEGAKFLAAALDGAGVPELPKYMMEGRFSHKTGHIMYHKTNEWADCTREIFSWLFK